MVCFNKTAEGEPAVTAQPVPNNPNAFHLAGRGQQDSISCTVYNQAPETATDLEIQKTASEEVVEPGSNVTYTLRVINHGPGDARNVIVRDRSRA